LILSKERKKSFALRGFAAYDRQLNDVFVLGGEIGVGRGGPEISGQQGTANFTVDQG